jgi:hypothetical protein
MIRGERFELNLDDDGDDHDTSANRQPRPVMPAAFVADVLERKATAPRPPQAPTMKHKTGFPEHRKRPTESRFKQQQKPNTSTAPRSDGNSSPASTSFSPAGTAPQRDHLPKNTQTKNVSFALADDNESSNITSPDQERAQIDRENNQRLAAMTPAQREAERQELIDSISPAFLQKLLMRANIDSGSAEVDLETDVPMAKQADERGTAPTVGEEVTGEEPAILNDDQSQGEKPTILSKPTTEPDPAIPSPLLNRDPAPAQPSPPSPSSSSAAKKTKPQDDDHHEDDIDDDGSSTLPPIHFPQPSQPPPLDPSSPSFQSDLHQKYFAHLPSNPSALAWTQSPSTATTSYDPSSTHLSASSLRFDFSGALLPPRLAASLPVTLGLHHHADAPDAAGYTLSELAHLSRSKFAAQRCLAFQTLGRILWRLGKGEFGNASSAAAASTGEGVVLAEEDDATGDADAPPPTSPTQPAARLNDPAFALLALGLWRDVDRLQIIPLLAAESTGGEGSVDGGRHVSAKAYATEALWLWRRSGGRRWKAA